MGEAMTVVWHSALLLFLVLLALVCGVKRLDRRVTQILDIYSELIQLREEVKARRALESLETKGLIKRELRPDGQFGYELVNNDNGNPGTKHSM
jgi:hypothetical protein